ncbi:MAG: hypothetical protein MZV64_29590 [Ignavibacteriales bacterium]|nr:hypothetical protein [Ignavibacteriales bacterium]
MRGDDRLRVAAAVTEYAASITLSDAPVRVPRGSSRSSTHQKAGLGPARDPLSLRAVLSAPNGVVALRQDPQHRIVDPPVRPDDLLHIDGGRGTTEIGHPSPRFDDHQPSGGHIPRLQRHLPESVKPSGGHPGEIERGGTESPDPARGMKEVREVFGRVIRVSGNVIRESGDEEALKQVPCSVTRRRSPFT